MIRHRSNLKELRLEFLNRSGGGEISIPKHDTFHVSGACRIGSPMFPAGPELARKTIGRFLKKQTSFFSPHISRVIICLNFRCE